MTTSTATTAGNGTRPETWKPVPGFGYYEASDHGRYRSVDRTLPTGRRCKGVVLATRVSNKGYVLVNMTDDHGVKQTRTGHTVVLTTFAGECPPGQQARHLDDNPLNNHWRPGSEDESRAAGGNLMWGTIEENTADRISNGVPREPKPVRHCVRCGGVITKGGRRCHDCVVELGVAAAALLASGATLTEACEALDYPSAEGMHTLAVKYGGYGTPVPVPVPATGGWLRGVIATLRDRLRHGDRT